MQGLWLLEYRQSGKSWNAEGRYRGGDACKGHGREKTGWRRITSISSQPEREKAKAATLADDIYSTKVIYCFTRHMPFKDSISLISPMALFTYKISQLA
jgi:hypothetical protein